MKKPTAVQMKNFTIDIIYDVVGSLLYGAGMYNFATASNFAPGGVSGLSILINHLTGLPIGLGIILLNIPIVLVCLKLLGKAFFARSIKSILISSIILDSVMPLIPMYAGETIIAAVFGGILSGAGLACIYMRASSTGGTDFVILAIRKKNPHLSIGNISLAVDGIIILLGALVYGSIDAALYGMIMTVCYSLIIDKLMYGIDARKLSIIITTKGTEIADRIGCEIERGVTVANGIGAYTGNKKQILLCTCSKAEVFKIKKIVFSIDEKAFFVVSPVDAAYGEGFKSQEE